jgi:hypothetical protein
LETFLCGDLNQNIIDQHQLANMEKLTVQMSSYHNRLKLVVKEELAVKLLDCFSYE